MTTASAPLPTRRADLLARLAQPHHYDLAVIGGGATGLGVALASQWTIESQAKAMLDIYAELAQQAMAPSA